jgi:NAD(P)H-hydrate epimerase
VVSALRILVDADALNILAKVPDWWEGLPKGRLLLTPHAGELARLTGRDGDELLADPLNAAMEAARTFGQHVLFKFGYGIVTDGKRALISDDAPASVATAGSGDVLAGTVGALLAQGLSPMDAAGLGLYVGARAARRLEATVGTLGMIASDLPLAIAQELARLERG